MIREACHNPFCSNANEHFHDECGDNCSTCETARALGEAIDEANGKKV